MSDGVRSPSAGRYDSGRIERSPCEDRRRTAAIGFERNGNVMGAEAPWTDEGGDQGRGEGPEPTRREEIGENAAGDSLQPLELEGERTVDEVCPHCGAPLRGAAGQPCLRCGFVTAPPPDAGIAATATAADETGEEAHSDIGAGAERPSGPEVVEVGPIVCVAGWDRWLPSSLALLAVAILLVGALAGARSLFPHARLDAAGEAVGRIAPMDRLDFVVRLPVQLILWTLCGVGAVATLAWLNARPIGSAWTAAIRLLAILAAARIVAFASAPWPIAEFALEALGQAIVFFLLAMLLFRLRPRDAGTLLGLTIIGAFLLYAVAEFVAWAM
jgi:hypothetical protein